MASKLNSLFEQAGRIARKASNSVSSMASSNVKSFSEVANAVEKVKPVGRPQKAFISGGTRGTMSGSAAANFKQNYKVGSIPSGKSVTSSGKSASVKLGRPSMGQMSYTQASSLTGASKASAFASDLGSATSDLLPFATNAVKRAGVAKTVAQGALAGAAINGTVGAIRGDDFWDSAGRGAVAGAVVNVGAKGIQGIKAGAEYSTGARQVANSVKTWSKNAQNSAMAIRQNGLYKG